MGYTLRTCFSCHDKSSFSASQKKNMSLSKRKVLAAGETVWECTKRRNEHACDVTVKSSNGVIVPPVFPCDHDYLHAPDPDEIEVLRAGSTMKRRAQDTAEPTQAIINRNIVPLRQQVLARIGTTESIKRDIRRQRTNNMPAVPDDND